MDSPLLTVDNSGIDLRVIPALLEGSTRRVHLVFDSPQAQPRTDAVNIFCSIEPPAIRPDVHAQLSNPTWCSKWDFIIAPSIGSIALPIERLRKLNLNSLFWVDIQEDPPIPKSFGISTIMSSKRITDGHRLRHWVRENWCATAPDGPKLTAFHGSEPAESASAIRQPYPNDDRRKCFRNMFHLVIENCRSLGYYTEKLMDSFRSHSVPIYWGAPDIGDYFAVEGMIIVGNLSPHEIMTTIQSLTVEDYEKRRDAIERNAKIAEHRCEGLNPFPLPGREGIVTQSKRLGRIIHEAQRAGLKQA